MDAAEQLSLDANPFVATAGPARVGRTMQAALGEIIRHIAQEIPLIVVAGAAGTGKTLLAGMVARACTGMGLSVLQIERGDLLHGPDQRSDLLVIDEADSLPDRSLSRLARAGVPAPASIVLFCLPANLSRFAPLSPRSLILTLAPLTSADSCAYLADRAAACGRPELFAPGASQILVEGSRGLPRLLRSLASLAYFNAAMEGASEIGPRHVTDALDSQLPGEPLKFESPEPPSATAALTRSPAFNAAMERASEIGARRAVDALESRLPSAQHKVETRTPTPRAAAPSFTAAFDAAIEGASEIGARHVADALASQLPSKQPKEEAFTPPRLVAPSPPASSFPAPLSFPAAPARRADSLESRYETLSNSTEALRDLRANANHQRSSGWFPHVVAGSAVLAGLMVVAAALIPLLRGVPQTVATLGVPESRPAAVTPIPIPAPRRNAVASASKDSPTSTPPLRNLAEAVQAENAAAPAPDEAASTKQDAEEEAARAARNAARAQAERQAERERAATAAAYARATREAQRIAAAAAERDASAQRAAAAAQAAVPEGPREVAVAPITPPEATQPAESRIAVADRAGDPKQEAKTSEAEADLAEPQGSGRSPMRILFDNILRFAGVSGR